MTNELLPTEAAASSVPLLEFLGAAQSSNARYQIQCLTIIGQVEGHYLLPSDTKTTKYEHLIPALAAIEQERSVQGLLLLLHTAGGDVEAGLAIAEMIAGMKTPTVSLVIGGGHSIGIPLAVSADRSFIVPSATMTLHPVRTNGLVVGVPQAFVYLHEVQNRINRFILQHSHIQESKLLSLMHRTDEMATDIGSVLSGAEAVDLGLIDQLGSLSDALDCLYAQIEAAPQRYAEQTSYDRIRKDDCLGKNQAHQKAAKEKTRKNPS